MISIGLVTKLNIMLNVTSGKHGAVKITCIYTRKNLLDLRKNFFKHTLDSDTYTRIQSLLGEKEVRKKTD